MIVFIFKITKHINFKKKLMLFSHKVFVHLLFFFFSFHKSIRIRCLCLYTSGILYSTVSCDHDESLIIKLIEKQLKTDNFQAHN